MKNRRFGGLLDEGISSVARRQGQSMAAAEDALAARLGYSGHTVRHWRRGNLPTDVDHVVAIARYCVEQGRVNRAWATAFLTQAAYRDAEPLLDELFGAPDGVPRVFICYARDRRNDEAVAFRLARALSASHDVFFDQARVGDDGWESRVQQELERAAFVVVLLSAEALHSEVTAAEVEMAHALAARDAGTPRLLPVRLAYRQPLPDPFRTYLDGLNCAFWQGEADTPAVIAAVSAALDGAPLPLDAAAQGRLAQQAPAAEAPLPSAQTTTLEMPEGTMSADSRFYVERAGDRIAMDALARQGVTVTIKGSRQVGKSSLLIRLKDAAAARGERIVYLDFQLFKSVLDDADAFFRLFCRLLSFQMQQPDETEAYWALPLPNPFRASEYVANHLLAADRRRLLLAMDEVDAVFAADFRTDFFAMLRSWHNNRAFDPRWKRLDLALVTSTEPYFFVDNLNQSPFNVGEVIELQPFTPAQVADLNARHGEPLSEAAVGRLHALVNGHPYLTRRALFLVTTGRFTPETLFSRATEDGGPFGDHLRSLLLRLHARAQWLPALREVLVDHACSDQHAFFRLRGAGLVRRDNGHIVPSNPLYARFLQTHLVFE